MNRDNQPWRPASGAELEWHGNVPVSRRYGDVYYSADNGLAESRYVFLQGNAIASRMSQQRDCLRIAETGFGTGLNFLATWQAWRAQPEPRPRLHFLSIERHPLTASQIRRALSVWPELSPLTEQLLAAIPLPLQGAHRLVFEQGRVLLDLWYEEAADVLEDLASAGQPLIDAWYLDGFAPSRNSELWEPALFEAIARLSRTGATFATFTAAGSVRRGLSDAGFTVEKRPGFGRKREKLVGKLARPAATPAADLTPWHLPEATEAVPDSVLVIGAGLAGSSVASALASRGVAVQVVDSGPVAGAGSGNEQGILYTRLSHRHSALADFALASFAHASRHYRLALASGALRDGEDGALCGVLHTGHSDTDRERLTTTLEALPALGRWLDPVAASTVTGLPDTPPGVWIPSAGWMHPPALCNWQLATPGIQVRHSLGALQLQRNNGAWEVVDRHGEVQGRAPVAVLATGTSTTSFAQCRDLPLRSIRGQTTLIPTGPGLRAGFCHAGYIAPARHGQHCIGATFDLDDPDTAVRPRDSQTNIDQLAAAVPDWREHLAGLDASSLPARVGHRCASPDYLPLAGPVPDHPRLQAVYAELRGNARRVIDARAPCHTGLYVSAGHGSRGLTSTPLAAELIASSICAEPPPLPRSLQRALAPARFAIRDLARNKA